MHLKKTQKSDRDMMKQKMWDNDMQAGLSTFILSFVDDCPKIAHWFLTEDLNGTCYRYPVACRLAPNERLTTAAVTWDLRERFVQKGGVDYAKKCNEKEHHSIEALPLQCIRKTGSGGFTTDTLTEAFSSGCPIEESFKEHAFSCKCSLKCFPAQGIMNSV